MAGNFESPDMVDLVGSLGLFDGIWIDMEHGPVVMSSLADMSRAADLWGMTSIVRVRGVLPDLIGLTLSQGIQGVIVPHVTTRVHAELIVDAAKVPPMGHRGAKGGRRAYGRPLAEHNRRLNDETFVAVMIEDLAGVENLPDILQVPHIDAFFVSHYDLAQDMGLHTDVHNPRLVETYDAAIAQIVGASRVAAAVVADADLEKYLKMGVRCLKVPGWQALLTNGYRTFVDRLGEARVGTGS